MKSERMTYPQLTRDMHAFRKTCYCSINTAPSCHNKVDMMLLQGSWQDSNQWQVQLWAQQCKKLVVQATRIVCEADAAWGQPTVTTYSLIGGGVTCSCGAGISRQRRNPLHQHSPSEAVRHATRAAT